tara:strand:- start:160 stop:735 length:576 start_codon:yes stop_codon:yes gene_type:complete
MSNAHHKVSNLGVGHGLSRRSGAANDPHSGPMPGDASFRLYFVSAEAYQAAMKKAAQLEAKGLMRRAWRVRLNLDGPQPVYTPMTNFEDDDEDVPKRMGRQPKFLPVPPLKIEKVIPPPPPPKPPKFSANPEVREKAKKMIKQIQLSHAKIAKALGVKKQAVTNWNKGEGITEVNFRKLEELVQKLKEMCK